MLGAASNLGSAISSPAAEANACSPQIEQMIAKAVSELNYNEALAHVDLLQQNATERFGKNTRCYAAALSERAAIAPVVMSLINFLRSIFL